MPRISTIGGKRLKFSLTSKLLSKKITEPVSVEKRPRFNIFKEKKTAEGIQ
jgi:hypothetical protein